jgi:hypothetical protein
MKEYRFWLKPEQYKVVAFYPYTSGVDRKILAQDHNIKTDEHDFLENFCNSVKDMALAKGCVWDNKVVIELEPIETRHNHRKSSNIFVGCYDGTWSVGLGVWQDAWLEKNGSNKYFND